MSKKSPKQEIKQQLFSMAVEQSPDSVIITDAEGNIEYVNQKFTTITGYSREEALGNNPRLLQSGKTKPIVYWRMWKTIKNGEEWKGVLFNKKKNGETFWESVNISPVKDKDGNITNFVAIKEDITDRKKREEQLQRLNVTLKALRRSGAAMMHASNEKDYLQEVCKVVVECCGHAMVFVALLEDGICKPVASMPEEIISSPEKMKKLAFDPFRINKIIINRGLPEVKGEFASSVVIPLKDNNKALGVISIYSFDKDTFSNDEVDLLSELADDLSYGIVTIRLRQAHKKGQEELEKHRSHLEELVKIRTNELEVSNKLLADSQQIAHYGHWHLDLVKNTLTWSDEIYRIFGISPQAFGATLEAFINTVHPEDRDRVLKAYTDSVRDKVDYSIEHRIVTPDNKVRLVHEQCTTSYDINGNPLYSLGVVQDITEKREAENEIKQHRFHLEELVKQRTEELSLANQQLKNEIEKEKQVEFLLKESLDKEKELSELKSRFISTTSHEFRTPLTAILSSLQLVQRYRKKWSDEKLEDQFLRVKNSIFYLTKLLDDTLTISYAESGRIIFNPQPVDLYALCQELIEDVKHKANAEHKILFRFQSQQHEFCLDVKLVRMILLNLLSNAFKYSPAGGKVKISVTFSNKVIKITVSDEGIGIPANDKEHLFSPFFRAGNTVEFEGTGLGLSIVKKAVELHKGIVQVQSEPNEGTVFTVKIPVN